jgi:hypothetical protein
MRKLFTLAAVIFFVFASAGFVRNNNPEFKFRCAAYQAHIADTLSGPDKIVCLAFYQLKN